MTQLLDLQYLPLATTGQNQLFHDEETQFRLSSCAWSPASTLASSSELGDVVFQPLRKGQLGHHQHWGDAQAEMSHITLPSSLDLTLSVAKVVLKKLVLGPFWSVTLPKGCENLSSEPRLDAISQNWLPIPPSVVLPHEPEVSFSHHQGHVINGLGG